MQETGHDVDDINYSFCDEVRQHCIELHRIAGGATLMAHWYREKEHTAVDSLDKRMQRLSCIFVGFEHVLPFSKGKETFDGWFAANRMEELTKELVKLKDDDEYGMDDID